MGKRLSSHAMVWGPVLAALGVYANALRNPFVYDDHRMVVDNPSLRDLANPLFVLVFQPFRPLVNASYALDFGVWGLDPLGFHLTSLLLHGLNVWLVFRLVSGLARLAPGDPARDAAAMPGRGVAAFTAALFAVHPMATESVGYVSGRAELLCATFVLLSLRCFQRSLDPQPRRRAWIAGGLASFALGLACKEVAAMLPVALLLADAIFLPPGDPGRRRRLALLHAPLLVLVAAGAVFRLHVYRSVDVPGHEADFAAHLLTQSWVAWHYLRLFVAPFGQSVVHQVPDVRSLADPRAAWDALAALGLAVLAARAWSRRRRDPGTAFGVLWFLAMLLPSALTPLAEIAAEHRTYLASAGLFLAASSLAARGLRALALPEVRRRRLAWGGGLALLAVLGGLTLARNRVWSDPVRLWSNALANAPLVFAPHYQLAEALRERDDCAGAIPLYERALVLVPSYLDAINNLGVCLARSGRLDEARRRFEEALVRDPSYPRAQNNLRTLGALEAARAAQLRP